MAATKDDELNRLLLISRRLQRTEDEIRALPDDEQARTVEYLYNRFGWFKRADTAIEA